MRWLWGTPVKEKGKAPPTTYPAADDVPHISKEQARQIELDDYRARRKAALKEGQRIAEETFAALPLANQEELTCPKCGARQVDRKFESSRLIGAHKVPVLTRLWYGSDVRTEREYAYNIRAAVVACSCAECGAFITSERPLDGGTPWLECEYDYGIYF